MCMWPSVVGMDVLSSCSPAPGPWWPICRWEKTTATRKMFDLHTVAVKARWPKLWNNSEYSPAKYFKKWQANRKRIPPLPWSPTASGFPQSPTRLWWQSRNAPQQEWILLSFVLFLHSASISWTQRHTGWKNIIPFRHTHSRFLIVKDTWFLFKF